ncbi:MAG: hypothetical protein KGI52_08445 [Burkholderiales bacterium]|nr:hypothetical protein [Burkholderiales bacterium]
MKFMVSSELVQATISLLNEMKARDSRHVLNEWEKITTAQQNDAAEKLLRQRMQAASETPQE